MNMETKVHATFSMEGELSSAQKESMDALNKHAEDICETLQPIFQNLVIEMLALKRAQFAQGGKDNEGS